MLLVRDVLDKQMVDRHGTRMGKVDGLVLQLDADGPPRVVYLEAGVPTLASRLGAAFGRWVAGLARRWGGEHPDSFRIPWSSVRAVTLEVSVDTDVEATRLNVVEDWLRVHIVERIPGGRP
jgi:sporulation protein YlmC with PRC-barrel domain